MTARPRPPATRSNVVRVRRTLAQIDRGAGLLRKKRQALVEELFERARPAVDAHREVEERARAAYEALLDALAAEGAEELRVLGWPKREVRVDLAPREVGGIHGVELLGKPHLARTVAARGSAIGPGDAAAEAAAEAFERLIELLLDLAPEDIFMRRLGQALGRVSRIVNTLEQSVGPGLTRNLEAMRRTLDEREREEYLRLKRRSRTPAR
jgi:V/A-type H+/Na+-transporting ATPase subunit D